MLPGATPVIDLPRFWSKVAPAGAMGCCEWTGARVGGYGVLRVWGRNVYAHRIAYANAAGREVSAAVLICHTCDNPPCCNPAHLFEGTPLDNNQDQERKGRKLRGAATAPKSPARGTANANSKLTPESVIEVRRLRRLGWSQQRIATVVGVSQTAVSDVLLGRTWSHA